MVQCVTIAFQRVTTQLSHNARESQTTEQRTQHTHARRREKDPHTQTNKQTNIGTAEQADKTLNKLKQAKQNPRKYAYKHAIIHTHTHTHLHVGWKDKNHVQR